MKIYTEKYWVLRDAKKHTLCNDNNFRRNLRNVKNQAITYERFETYNLAVAKQLELGSMYGIRGCDVWGIDPDSHYSEFSGKLYHGLAKEMLPILDRMQNE